MKKIIIIASILTVGIGLGLTFAYLESKTPVSKVEKITSIDEIKEVPDRTGGTAPQPIEADVKEGEAINKLINRLPYKTESFTITGYDYKKAKFEVTFLNKTEESEEELTVWLTNSEFATIPEARFLIK